MNRHKPRRHFSDSPRPSDSSAARIAPWIALGSVSILGGVVHELGAGWIAERTFGLPAGAWCAILAGSLVSLRQRPRAVSVGEEYAAAMHSAGAATRELLTFIYRQCVRGAHGAAPIAARVVQVVNERWGDRLSDWLERRRGASVIRVLDESGLACRAPGASRVRASEWLTGGARDSCDALLTRQDDDLLVETPIRAGRDAAWFDWSERCPLSYGSVFPGRIDPERVTLRDGSLAAAGIPRVVAAIVDAAGAASRHADRLDLSDRLRGRTPLPCDGADSYLARLAEITAEHAGAAPGETLRVAARVSSAWLVRASIDDGKRLHLLEAAAAIGGDEPEIMLRLAAARFAAFDDTGGIDALLRADRMLRTEKVFPGADPALFIQSEFSHGTPSGIALGRVAAGICMLCSSAPIEKLAFIRDDLFDDMRYAGLLVGADQERSLLIEVFRALERARRAETFVLPAAKAA